MIYPREIYENLRRNLYEGKVLTAKELDLILQLVKTCCEIMESSQEIMKLVEADKGYLHK